MYTIVKEERALLPDGWTIRHVPIVKATISDNNDVVCRVNKHLIYTFDHEGGPVCGAYNVKRKTYCRKSPLRGSNRCLFHGGTAKR